MNKILYPILAMMLSACGSEGMQTERSANGAEAKLIAVVKQCELWRVNDGNIRSVYMSICDDQVSGSTQYSENCGKGCTRLVQTTGQLTDRPALAREAGK